MACIVTVRDSRVPPAATDLGGAFGPETGGSTKIRAPLSRRRGNTRTAHGWRRPRLCNVTTRSWIRWTSTIRRSSRKLERLADSCDPPLFGYDEGKKTETAVSQPRVMQGDLRASMPGEYSAVATIHGDGPLTILKNVTGTVPQHPNHSIVGVHRLDPDMVCDRFREILVLCFGVVERPRPFGHFDPLLHGVGLWIIGGRTPCAYCETIGCEPDCPSSQVSGNSAGRFWPATPESRCPTSTHPNRKSLKSSRWWN